MSVEGASVVEAHAFQGSLQRGRGRLSAFAEGRRRRRPPFTEDTPSELVAAQPKPLRRRERRTQTLTGGGQARGQGNLVVFVEDDGDARAEVSAGV